MHYSFIFSFISAFHFLVSPFFSHYTVLSKIHIFSDLLGLFWGRAIFFLYLRPGKSSIQVSWNPLFLFFWSYFDCCCILLFFLLCFLLVCWFLEETKCRKILLPFLGRFFRRTRLCLFLCHVELKRGLHALFSRQNPLHIHSSWTLAQAHESVCFHWPESQAFTAVNTTIWRCRCNDYNPFHCTGEVPVQNKQHGGGGRLRLEAAVTLLKKGKNLSYNPADSLSPCRITWITNLVVRQGVSGIFGGLGRADTRSCRTLIWLVYFLSI